MARPADHRRGERGIALVIVLWTLVILAMLTLGFSTSSRTETRVAANGAEQIRIRALLRGGVELAVFALGEAEDAHGWRPDGTPYPAEIDGDRLTIRIRDEAGRVDLNRADAETLERLIAAALSTPEAAQRLTAAILHRRGDEDVAAPAAENTIQPEAGGQHSLRRPFQSREELRRVPGVTRAIADALMPHVTVLSPGGGINPVAADPVVLQALPWVSRAQAEALVRARQARPAPTPEQLASLLPADLGDRLRSKAGPIFAVTVEAASRRGGHGRVEAVIWVAADDQAFYRILDWREAGLDARTPEGAA